MNSLPPTQCASNHVPAFPTHHSAAHYTLTPDIDRHHPHFFSKTAFVADLRSVTLWLQKQLRQLFFSYCRLHHLQAFPRPQPQQASTHIVPAMQICPLPGTSHKYESQIPDTEYLPAACFRMSQPGLTQQQNLRQIQGQQTRFLSVKSLLSFLHMQLP